MARLDAHPTVERGRAAEATPNLTAERLRTICLEAGAADVGFVSIDRPEIADERQHVLWTKSAPTQSAGA